MDRVVMILDVLEGAKKKLEHGWTQVAFARNEAGRAVQATSADACCWCLSGALMAGAPTSEHFDVIGDARTLLVQELSTDKANAWDDIAKVMAFNDDKATTKEMVIALVDKTIDLVKKKEKT